MVAIEYEDVQYISGDETNADAEFMQIMGISGTYLSSGYFKNHPENVARLERERILEEERVAREKLEREKEREKERTGELWPAVESAGPIEVEGARPTVPGSARRRGRDRVRRARRGTGERPTPARGGTARAPARRLRPRLPGGRVSPPGRLYGRQTARGSALAWLRRADGGEGDRGSAPDGDPRPEAHDAEAELPRPAEPERYLARQTEREGPVTVVWKAPPGAGPMDKLERRSPTPS